MGKHYEIVVSQNGEWTDVTMDITRSDRAVEGYPDPKFVPLDLSIAEARDLAARLTAAADEAAKYNRELDAYFEAHPCPLMEVSDDPAPREHDHRVPPSLPATGEVVRLGGEG